MKKIALLVIAFTTAALAGKAQDKAFKKGDMSMELGTGFGIYGTYGHQEYDQDVATWNGTSVVVTKERVSQNHHDGAVSAIYPITYQYGVTNWLGIGGRVAFSKYYGEDSVTHVKPTSRAIDVDAFADFHLVKSRHFDMPIRVTGGYSHFYYDSNDMLENTAKGGGANFGIALIPRIYFGNHIGIYFNVGYASYVYPNLKFSNNNDSNLNDNNNMTYKLTGSGLNMGIGIVAKF